MQAIKIEPGCKPELTEMPNTPRAFQQAVGGHIEAHTITRSDLPALVVILNEEGRLQGLPAIVAQVRSAGNPQMAAMEAVADNEYLVDSELLEALGVASFGDLPTTPYPDAPMRTRPDRRRSPAKSPGRSLGQSAKVQRPKMRRPHPAPCGMPWGGRWAVWRSSPPSGRACSLIPTAPSVPTMWRPWPRSMRRPAFGCPAGMPPRLCTAPLWARTTAQPRLNTTSR